MPWGLDARSSSIRPEASDRSYPRPRRGWFTSKSPIDETELPLTKIVAQNSTFSTAGKAPLFRVDGQGHDGSIERPVSTGQRKRLPTIRS